MKIIVFTKIQADFEKGIYVRGAALGMDDPLDAPWRKDAEKVIREAVFTNYEDADDVDVYWVFNGLQVTIFPKVYTNRSTYRIVNKVV